METDFAEFEQLAQERGIAGALDHLEARFRQDRQYPQLFELLKMKVRYQLGLPLMRAELPEDPDRQRQLEDGLLEACREVGSLLVESGRLQEGWMYLQPVGDRKLNDRLISEFPVDEENLDLVINIAVSEGAAPVTGFKLLLEHYGTCNGITTFDTQAGRFDRATQTALAETLVEHLYGELVRNIRQAVGLTVEEPIAVGALRSLMASHPELTVGGAHHIDTTHLASTMRIARLAHSTEAIARALELAEYGCTLASDYHYAGHPPFESVYEDHRHYFSVLAGEQIEAGLAHFRAKLDAVNVEEYGPVAIETLIDLLVRAKRYEDATRVMVDQLLGQHASLGIAPDPLEVAQGEGPRQLLRQHYLDRGDLLGFATCVLAAAEESRD